MSVHGRLSQDDWDAMMRGIVLSKYQLLLGAGASREVRDRFGRALPSGDGMAEEICRTFDINAAGRERTDLARVFRAASRSKTSNGSTREQWLTERFAKTRPPRWFDLLGAANWRNIWTLNIDDSVERALPEQTRSFHFADTGIRTQDGTTPVVHLHGYAGQADRPFVFSVDEYRQYVTTARSIPTLFQETLSDNPFIIIGAALHHEFDLAAALRDRAQAIGRDEPTIAVMPNPTDLDVADFEAWNIQIYDGTAEEFLREVRDDLTNAANSAAGALGSGLAPSPALVRFLEQWHPTLEWPKSRWHDYLSGDEPEPADVRNGIVAPRDSSTDIVSNLRAGNPVVVHGGPFAGKSSVALAVAAEMEAYGYRAFTFSGEATPDIPAVLQRIRDVSDTLLIIEYAGEFARSIEQLIARATSLGLPIRLLLVERDGPAQRLNAIDGVTSVHIANYLSDSELRDIVEILQVNSRIISSAGDVSTKSLRKRKIVEITHVISSLVLGEAFDQRVSRDFRQLKDPLVHDTVVLAALTARVGGGITIGSAAAALETTARNIEDRLFQNDVATSMVRLDGPRIRVRHRLFGELLTRNFIPRDEVLRLLVRLCLALAPQIDASSVSANTWAYRVSRHFLDHDQLAGLIGRHRLADFYSEIESGFAWNTRFWEQRALAASKDGDHPMASRFANQGILRHRDAYSVNTLATVQLHALWDNNPSSDPGLLADGFRESSALLREARDYAKHSSEHPFVNFFTNAIRLANYYSSHNVPLPRDVKEEFSLWWNLASRHPLLTDVEGSQKMHDFQARWLRALARVDDVSPI